MLHFLAFVGFGIWPLAFASLIPLWWALEQTRGESRVRAAAVGLVFGWVAYAGGYHWIWRIVDVFLGGDVALGASLWLVHSVWFALRFGLYALLYTAARRRGWPVAAAAVPALVAIEWLYPSLFPVNVGAALVDRTALVQMLDLGGPLLLSAWLTLEGAALFETLRFARGRCPRPLATWIAAGFVALLGWGYGAVRIHDLEAALTRAPAIELALVQANLGALEKRGDPEIVHRRYLEQTRELLAGGVPDLVVWPETVYARGLRRPLPLSGRLVRRELDVPLLFGAASVRTDTGRRVVYNSALLVGADGVIRDAYDKNLLIPFAEYVPLAGVAPWLAALFPHAQEFAAATDTPALSLGPWRISTPICYEAVRPGFVRRMVESARPHLIVSLANDAWFGDSQEPWIHLALARMRAVEERRTLVRATNSGVSAVVDPLGRVVARTGLGTRENLRAPVSLLDGESVYARAGDWPGWIAAVLTIGLLLAPGRPPGRRDGGSGQLIKHLIN